MQKANCGYKLKVGDVIMIRNWMNSSYHTVTKITNKYAFCSEVGYTYRFPVEYSSQFKALPRERWDTNEYTVFMSVDND